AGPLRLRLERRERGLHGWRSKPAAFEIAADGGVAVAAGGKRLGARGGGALVVDVARRREALDRLRRLGGVDAGPLQGGRELGRRVVPPRERLGRGRGLLVGLDRRRLPWLALGQEPRGDDLPLGRLRLDPLQDLLDDVGVLLEEGGRVLAPLAEPLVAEAEVRARLLDDLPLDRRVEDGPLPGDALAVDDVELGLLERRRDLVLRHLDANAVADRLDAVLQRLDPADV